MGATQTREVGGPCARASCGLAAGGVACARSGGYCAGASGTRAPGRGAAGRGPPRAAVLGRAAAGAVRARGQRGWSPRGVSRLLSALGVQPSFLGAARVMVLGGRKRRDSASVGARVAGLRRPGNRGSGELAAGWTSGHNRRRWPGEEPRE